MNDYLIGFILAYAIVSLFNFIAFEILIYEEKQSKSKRKKLGQKYPAFSTKIKYSFNFTNLFASYLVIFYIVKDKYEIYKKIKNNKSEM